MCNPVCCRISPGSRGYKPSLCFCSHEQASSHWISLQEWFNSSLAFFLYSVILFLVKFIFWCRALEPVSSSCYNCHCFLLPFSSPCIELSHGEVSLSLNLEPSTQDLCNFLWISQVCKSDSEKCWQAQKSRLGRAVAQQTGRAAWGAPLRAVAQDQPPGLLLCAGMAMCTEGARSSQLQGSEEWFVFTQELICLFYKNIYVPAFVLTYVAGLSGEWAAFLLPV